MSKTVIIAVALGVLLLTGAFAWWSVRRLWRPATTVREYWVYTRGVKFFGVASGLCMVGLQLIMSIPQARHYQTLLIMVPFTILLGISLFLWAGYWWGTFMADRMGATDAPLPPPSQQP